MAAETHCTTNREVAFTFPLGAPFNQRASTWRDRRSSSSLVSGRESPQPDTRPRIPDGSGCVCPRYTRAFHSTIRNPELGLLQYGHDLLDGKTLLLAANPPLSDSAGNQPYFWIKKRRSHYPVVLVSAPQMSAEVISESSGVRTRSGGIHLSRLGQRHIIPGFSTI